MAPDVVVIGLGYVGLPLAQRAAAAGLRVGGLDHDERVVEGLMSGRSHVDDLDDSAVSTMVAAGFEATTDVASVGGSPVWVICVPTPLAEGGGPDLVHVVRAAETIAPSLRSGDLVVLESTTYPGTTEEVLGPVLEDGSGLRVGTSLHLAFSPERIDPGNEVYDVKNTPKVVGGVTPDATSRAVAFYSTLVDSVVEASGTREAEMAKLLENTYRHVNIALVNEMSKFCRELDIDLWEVVRLASTKPFGFQPFYPGPGVGGHCIPIDPNYLSHRVRSQLGYPFRFVELAQEINDSMPAYVARRVQDRLNADGLAVSGSRVLLLGVTYKADLADERESPARPLAAKLVELGALVQWHDPYVDAWGQPSTERVDDPVAAARESDLVVLVQAHSAYDLVAFEDAADRLLDTRGVTRSPRSERL